MLFWCEKAWGLKFSCIRYFNAAGGALDGSIGEDHPNESHLIPLAIRAAIEGKTFRIFGNDYSTHDKTCVRDYIHVIDLSEIHTLALQKLMNGKESSYFNAGLGIGYSNLQIINMIKKVTGLKFKVGYTKRRPGDAAVLYASNKKIRKELSWYPKYGFKEIIKTAYLWHKFHPRGYSG
jgi:UDP-glucose 4-epimerase